MLQIDSQGLIIFRNQSSRLMNAEDLRLSNSSYPALIIPLNSLRSLIDEELDSILDYRIVTSENTFILKEIDSIITEFNKDLNGFSSTLALIATWQV